MNQKQWKELIKLPKENRGQNFFYYRNLAQKILGYKRDCVLMTTEEHNKVHHLSEETKEKISKSVSIAKTKYTPEQLKEQKRLQDKKYTDSHKEQKRLYDKKYYEAHKDKIKQRARKYKLKNKKL